MIFKNRVKLSRCLSVSLLTLAVSGMAACSSMDEVPKANIEYAPVWEYAPRSEAAISIDKEWWRAFESKQLTQLVDIAQQKNPDWIIANENVKQAELQMKIANASLFPSLGLSASSGESNVKQANGSWDATGSSRANLTANYEVDLWGGAMANRHAAKAGFKSAEFANEASRLSITASVATAWFNYLTLLERLDTARKNIEIADRIQKIVDSLYRNGAASAADVAAQKTNLLSQQNVLLPLQLQLDQTRAAIALLEGQIPQAYQLPSEKILDIKIPDINAGIPADVIARRPQWQISAGLRAERFYTKTDQIVRQGAVTSGAQTVPIGTPVGRDAEVADNLISWKLGGVYKPAENGSIYLSYATSQLPPGSANFQLNTDPTSTITANTPNLDPQKGTNQELGTKWNINGNKLAVTAAIFKSTNENEIATNTDASSVAVGEREVKGIELGLSGIVMQNWQISAGFAYMDPKITRGNRSTASSNSTQTDGGVIQWSPKYTFTLWNSYLFSNGLTIAGGARYIDSVASSSLTDATAQSHRSILNVPEYWVFDAMASYVVTKNVTLQLNVLNLADEEYIGSLNNSGARYYPGAPRSVRLGANFSF